MSGGATPGEAPPTGERHTAEQRTGHRVPVRLAVDAAGGTPLGETRDLSLDGTYVLTPTSHEPGERLTVSLGLGDGRDDLVLDAVVVRRDGGGLALRFDPPEARVGRDLRRFVAELTSVSGRRDTARRLLAIDDRAIEPIRRPEAIAEALEAARAAATPMTVMPASRQLRENYSLVSWDAESLVLRGAAPSALLPEEEVFVLYSHDYASWTFGGRVSSVDAHTVRLPFPTMIAYSERRGAGRATRPGATLTLPLSWDRGRSERWSVDEHSEGGFSLLVPMDSCPFRSGQPLDGAQLDLDGETLTLEDASVRHVSQSVDDEGRPCLRVGISHGSRRALAVTTHTQVRPAKPQGPVGRIARTVRRWTDAASYLFHRSRPTSRPEGGRGGEIEVVHIPWGERTVTGLLNRPHPEEIEPIEGPLVIVVPGFGGRKEQTSFLATTLAHTFRQEGQELAILRIDGTNNLGESWKTEEARGPGRATLRFRTADVLEDLRACLQWSRSNDRVIPNRIILISASFGSIPVRHFLATGEGREVSLWVSYFGAADARNSIQHVSGHLDIFDNHARGLKNGVHTLGGCVVDVDHFFEDLRERKIGQLADACREMSMIHCDVDWIMGRYDAYMDPRRVREVMNTAAPGARRLREVDAGHIPTSGEEARAQAGVVASLVWEHLHRSPLEIAPPSLGKLQARAKLEWDRVKRDGIDRQSYWREYLLAEDSPGFDVLTLSAAYNDFVQAQVDALQPRRARVLDLGAGTGNVALAIARSAPNELVCADLVAPALRIVEEKLAPIAVRASFVQLDADGSPASAMARWLDGDLAGIRALGRRLPGFSPEVLRELEAAWSADLHAVSRGAGLDASSVGKAAGLSADATAVLHDLGVLAMAARGALMPQEATLALARLPGAALAGAGRLPWPDARFDAIVMSLLLSYLEQPDDVMAEAHRLLAPGGRIVVSSMRRDADSSRLFHALLSWLETAPEHELGDRWTRAQLKTATQRFIHQAAELLRLQEEGFFHFYDADELVHRVRRAGFVDVSARTAFGDPPQAVIVSGLRR